MAAKTTEKQNYINSHNISKKLFQDFNEEDHKVLHQKLTELLGALFDKSEEVKAQEIKTQKITDVHINGVFRARQKKLQSVLIMLTPLILLVNIIACWYLLSNPLDIDKPNFLYMLINRILAGLPFAILDFFMIQQYIRFAHLEEAYAHKALIADSIDSYNTILVRNLYNYEEEFMGLKNRHEDFLFDSLQQIYKNVGDSKINKTTPFINLNIGKKDVGVQLTSATND